MKRRSYRSSHTWHLVTNHQNMLYMLAAGMVMGPAGFGGKYYSDPLAVFPGCVPVFRDINKGKRYIPSDALQQAVSERKHLVPCIASFDLSDLVGPSLSLKCDGGLRPVESPSAKKRKNEIARILPAPLPMSLLQSISFRSDEDRQAFETAARDVDNVALSDSIIEVDKSLFTTDSEIIWPPQIQTDLVGTNRELQCENTSPYGGLAIGGILAMLYHAANRSDLGLAVYRIATGSVDNNESIQENPALKELHTWLNEGTVSDQAGDHARIYWGVVDALIHARSQEPQEAPIDTTLNYLEGAQEKLQKQERKDALEKLIADMRGCLGLGAGTISELFERHQGSQSRSLLLFCLREHSKDLLEFSHENLKDLDYILACILFGVRDGWLRLPRELRNPSLSNYISYRMADYEHKKWKSQLHFGSPPKPVPFLAYFSTSDREWSKKQKEMALEVAKKCGWNDCIYTYITPRTGGVLDDIENHDSQIKIRGRVSVREEVDRTSFLQRLGRWPSVPSQIQAEMRSAFECEGDLEMQCDGRVQS